MCTDLLFQPSLYNGVLAVMAVLAVVVFFALQRLEAAYGMAYSPKWGPSLGNKTGWVLMEIPAFLVFAAIWVSSPRRLDIAPAIMGGLFELHYFQRTFIFPFLMRGKSKMPVAITAMGIIFNSINAYLVAGWLFFVSSPAEYLPAWLVSPQFIAGVLVFAAGMAINLHSDNIVRHLRRPGDTRHYIPRGGLYRWVTAANYTGEFLEWIGFAVMTWSVAGAVFALWTFANLAPRAKSLHARYLAEFGEDFRCLKRKYIIPFIY